MANLVRRAFNRAKVSVKNTFWRGFIARRIRDYRRMDRSSYLGGYDEKVDPENVYYTNSGLRKYNENFGVNFAEIARRLGSKQERIRVLDIGAGQGLFGLQLQKALGPRQVELHAIGFTRPFHKHQGEWQVTGKELKKEAKEPWKQFASFHVGDFNMKGEKKLEDESFDLVVSHSSVTLNYQSLMKIAKKLRQGGEAYVQMIVGKGLVHQATMRTLEEKGFRVEVLKSFLGESGKNIGFLKLVRKS